VHFYKHVTNKGINIEEIEPFLGGSSLYHRFINIESRETLDGVTELIGRRKSGRFRRLVL